MVSGETRASAAPPPVGPVNLGTEYGMRIEGDNDDILGIQVDSAGDMNKDGRSDLLVLGYTRLFVVFGTAGQTRVDVRTLPQP